MWILDVIKELFLSKIAIAYILKKNVLYCTERNVHICGPVFPA